MRKINIFEEYEKELRTFCLQSEPICWKICHWSHRACAPLWSTVMQINGWDHHSRYVDSKYKILILYIYLDSDKLVEFLIGKICMRWQLPSIEYSCVYGLHPLSSSLKSKTHMRYFHGCIMVLWHFTIILCCPLPKILSQ